MIYRNFVAVVMVLLTGLTGTFALAATQDDNTVWIDVRTAREYRQGHLEGAINIPHGDVGHKIFQFVPNTFVEVHLYDGTPGGTFAGLALEMLMEMGFQSVYNEGGYEQLLERLAAGEQVP